MATAQTAKLLIEKYFQACNNADRQGLLDCFTEDATHYFPPGLPDIPWRNAEKIADMWVWCVHTMGSRWTIERFVANEDGSEAVVEWTHWKTYKDEVLRGDEWYLFNDDVTRIREVRAFYASAVDRARPTNELPGFDYEGRGYALAPPSAPPKGK